MSFFYIFIRFWGKVHFVERMHLDQIIIKPEEEETACVTSQLSRVTCQMKPVTCHLTTTLCSFTGYYNPRWFGDAALEGVVMYIVKVEYFVFI